MCRLNDAEHLSFAAGDLVFPSIAGKVMSYPYLTKSITAPVVIATGLAVDDAPR